MERPTSFSDLSGSSKGVIYVTGLCFLALAGIFVAMFIQGVISVFAALFSVKASKPSQPKRKQKQKRKKAAVHVEAQASTGNAPPQKKTPQSGKTYKELVKESKAAAKQKGGSMDKLQSHPLHLHAFKEHRDVVGGLSWSQDASLLCTACEDRTVRVFEFSGSVDKGVHSRQITIHGTPIDVAFGRDGKRIAVLSKGVADSAMLSLFNHEQIDNVWKWVPSKVETDLFHKEPPLKMESGVSPETGRAFFVCCSQTKEAKVFDENGVALSIFEPNSFNNHDLAVSHNAQFTSVGTFTADAKIWELQFTRDGTFKGSPRVMDLKGHKSQITSVVFTWDASRAVTVSKDGFLKVWKTDVQFKYREDPKCLLTVKQDLPEGESYQRLAFSPHNILAASFKSDIHFININDGSVISKIDAAHNAHITALSWSPTPLLSKKGESYVLASSGADAKVRMWKCP